MHSWPNDLQILKYSPSFKKSLLVLPLERAKNVQTEYLNQTELDEFCSLPYQGFQVSLSQSPTFYNGFILRTRSSPFRNKITWFWLWKRCCQLKQASPSWALISIHGWQCLSVKEKKNEDGSLKGLYSEWELWTQETPFPVNFPSVKHWKWSMYPFSASQSMLSVPGSLTAFLKCKYSLIK